MKKILLLLSLLAFSINSFSHCGSCGVGGSKEDHHEDEDTTHHERDAKFEEVDERREAIINDEDSDSSEVNEGEAIEPYDE